MNYSRMYMYESSGPMHIHKIILLTPRDRRQIVGVTLKCSEGGKANGKGGIRRCGRKIKMQRCIEGCAFPMPVDEHDSEANASVVGGKWA